MNEIILNTEDAAPQDTPRRAAEKGDIMEKLSQFLSPVDICIQDLLLDPNNPRFAELGEPIDIVPEYRYLEDRIQKEAFERMKKGNFDVAELRDTIKTLGFLPVDRIVVRSWQGNPQKYVVIEGNRRISALKWLLELHDSGKETFTQEQIDNFTKLKALLLDSEKAPDAAKWILPGLRHVSGIKAWGAYQKARAVFVLRESGCSPQEAAQSLGLATRSANQLWRSYLALEQMKNDEEFGEFAEPKMYSYFEEVFKRSNVREWLIWDDNERKFTNDSHLKEFYGWMLGEQNDDGEFSEPKLPEAKSIRDLGTIINDEPALNVFRVQGGTLPRALARFEAEHPEDWKPIITQAEIMLSKLSPDILRELTAEDIKTISLLKERILRVLNDRDILIGKKNGRD